MSRCVRAIFRQGSLLLLGLPLGGLLTGCGMDVQRSAGPTALPGMKIHGNVHGGVYPIQGATIRLMETQSNGYGAAAKQLLQTTSDNNGYFTFADTGWSCDSNQFAYITVTAGHTSSNANNYNVGQIGIIGNCGEFLANKSEVDAVEVFVSELSTIAAAYTLRSFITIDNTNAATGEQIVNISAPANNNAAAGSCTTTTPVTCVSAGLAHGFQNAYNLVDSVNFSGVLPTGQARLTPPTNGFAYVPQEAIDTLGNILQSCVDSPGGSVSNYSTYTPGGTGSTRCGDLFYWATPPGGTSPTNTLQVALNMAQYPTNNVVNLFDLQPRAVFFTPTLSQAPNDLTLSLFYLTETFGAYTGDLVAPVGLTLDANDNAYILAASASGSSNAETAILGISSNGTVQFAGPVNTNYLNPAAIATDSLGNIWFTNDSTGSYGGILKASSSNGAISVGAALPSAAGLMLDKFNNVWVGLDSATANSIQEFSNGSLTGGTVTPKTESVVSGYNLTNVNLDVAGNIWTLLPNSSGNSTAGLYPNTGTSSAPSYSGGAIQTLKGAAGVGIAPSSSSVVYMPLSNQVDEASYSNGNFLANNLGTFSGSSQDGSTYAAPNQSQVDGAGNLFWTDLEASGRVFQFIPSSSTSMNGTLNALLPCYPVSGACYVPAVSNLRGMRIDSTGTLWYLANASYGGYPIGVVIQTFGVGAPAWPLQSLQKPGAMPQ